MRKVLVMACVVVIGVVATCSVAMAENIPRVPVVIMKAGAVR